MWAFNPASKWLYIIYGNNCFVYLFFQSSNQGLIDKMLLSQQQRIKANQQAQSETPDIPTVDVSFNLIGLERMTELQNKKRFVEFSDLFFILFFLGGENFVFIFLCYQFYTSLFSTIFI